MGVAATFRDIYIHIRAREGTAAVVPGGKRCKLGGSTFDSSPNTGRCLGLSAPSDNVGREFWMYAICKEVALPACPLRRFRDL